MKNKNIKRIIRLGGILLLIVLVGFLIFNLVPESIKQKITDTVKKEEMKILDTKNDVLSINGKYIWVGTDLLNTKGGMEKPLTDEFVKEGYVAIFENGKFSSTTLCNSLMGSYNQNGSEIKFGPMASTLMACAENVMIQEQKYSSWFEKVNFFEINGEYLYLKDKEGTFKMNFKVLQNSQTGIKDKEKVSIEKKEGFSTEYRYKKNNIDVDVENEVTEIGVDLDGDTIPEFISLVENKNYCGTGGCTLYVFRIDGTVVTKMTVTERPVYLSNEQTNGWNDFVVYSDGSLRKISFNGKTYNTNPSLAPKLLKKEVDENTGTSIDKKYFLMMPVK